MMKRIFERQRWLVVLIFCFSGADAAVVDIGNRRELFGDH